MNEGIGPFAPGFTIFDVTVPMDPGMAVWPGDPATEITPVLSIARGDEANVSRLTFSSHAGTHVDAPWHFLDNGATLDAIPIERWIGQCIVTEVPADAHAIDQMWLATALGAEPISMVILKTRSDSSPAPDPAAFDPAFAALTVDGARWLIERGVRLVGIDTPSIEAADGGGEVHRVLLGHEVLIVEGLDLRGVTAGLYTLICLPLKLQSVDGAPARVLLVRNG